MFYFFIFLVFKIDKETIAKGNVICSFNNVNDVKLIFVSIGVFGQLVLSINA